MTGRVVDLDVHDMAHGGEAVGRHDGKAVFVAGAIPGERVRVSLVSDSGTWARAHLEEVLTPAPARVPPPCPHFADCGGCQWQYMTYAEQLKWKSSIVAGQLQHLGGVSDPEVAPIVASSAPYGYRNRMTFHVENGLPALYRHRSKQLVPISACLLLVAGLAELYDRLGDLSGKRVLVRTDFNVPLDDGQITDDFRIRAALPTIEWLTDRGAVVVTASHLGRPKGVPDAKYSMDPVRARLGELAPGVELLENLRFDPGETSNDPAFVARLVDGIDAYVNDAFGASHRAHASIVGPPEFVPSAMGRLLQKEVEVLLGLRNKPKHPFVAVLGGAKISDKLGVVEALLEVVDSLIVGGAMCFTFFAAQGNPIGDSLFEPDQVDTCKRLLAEAGAKGKTIHLPEDITGVDARGEYATFGTRLPEGAKGFDIGPGSAAAFTDVIMDARMVFWNGPMGMFEDERFAHGTRTVAHAMAETKAFTVVGGGDSAAALAQFKLDDEVDHVSTGGGASLELLENGDLPGLQALRKGTS